MAREFICQLSCILLFYVCACVLSYCGTYFNTTRNQVFAIFFASYSYWFKFRFRRLVEYIGQCKPKDESEKFIVGLILLRFQYICI